MGFLKFLIGFIITGRFLAIVAFILISLGAFYIFSDATFMTNIATKVKIILENSAGNIVAWVVDYIQKIKEMF
jgi:hypothetical protein